MGFVVFEDAGAYFADNTQPVVVTLNAVTGVSLIISDSMIVSERTNFKRNHLLTCRNTPDLPPLGHLFL